MITPEEQMEICKAITKACMWGHSGLGSVIIDKLQAKLPTDPTWQRVHAANEKIAKHEAVGVVTDEKDLQGYIRGGYLLCNYSPGELSIHYPHRGGGLCKYVVGELADKYGELYDSWNFEAHQRRRQAERL